MVAQKITVSPRGGEDIGKQYDHIERHGFFANESQDPQYVESRRDRSVKVRKEPTNEPSLRSCDRPRNGNSTLLANANNQLFRGKRQSPAREY